MAAAVRDVESNLATLRALHEEERAREADVGTRLNALERKNTDERT